MFYKLHFYKLHCVSDIYLNSFYAQLPCESGIYMKLLL